KIGNADKYVRETLKLVPKLCDDENLKNDSILCAILDSLNKEERERMMKLVDDKAKRIFRVPVGRPKQLVDGDLGKLIAFFRDKYSKENAMMRKLLKLGHGNENVELSDWSIKEGYLIIARDLEIRLRVVIQLERGDGLLWENKEPLD